MKLEIQKVPLKDKIASILMQKIIDGEIKAGEKLKEAHLAKSFGVSQAPVREAIISLVAKGILEHTPNVGTHVKSYSKDDILEIYQTREALELYSKSFIQDIDIALLKKEYQQMLDAAKSKDIKLLVEHDQNFHEILLSGSKNCTIKNIWRELYTKSSVQNIIKNLDISLEEIVRMHMPIIEALENKSNKKYVQALNNHYRIIIEKTKDKK